MFNLQDMIDRFGDDVADAPVSEDDEYDVALREALAAINGYLSHYNQPVIARMDDWLESFTRILALLRHMEDVLPAPLPSQRPHPLYPGERQ